MFNGGDKTKVEVDVLVPVKLMFVQEVGTVLGYMYGL